MAELVTIARPYAEAAFRLARGKGVLAAWSDRLRQMAAYAQNIEVAACLTNPSLTAEQKADIILALLQPMADADIVNFVRILAGNNRLTVLPQIAEFFETLKSAEEGVKNGIIKSAFALDDKQCADLQPALEKHFKSKLRLTTRIEPDLIGGIVVEVGDQVLDRSIRGQLATMSAVLSSA